MHCTLYRWHKWSRSTGNVRELSLWKLCNCCIYDTNVYITEGTNSLCRSQYFSVSHILYLLSLPKILFTQIKNVNGLYWSDLNFVPSYTYMKLHLLSPSCETTSLMWNNAESVSHLSKASCSFQLTFEQNLFQDNAKNKRWSPNLVLICFKI